MKEENSLLKKMKQMLSAEEEDVESKVNEIMTIMDEGHKQGIFDSSEVQMMRNLFKYGDQDAKDIMTHRKHIIGIEGSETVETGLPLLLKKGFSRFPIFEEDIDNIIGTLHLRDLMQCYLDEEKRKVPIKDLKGLIRAASYVPETKGIDRLFEQMQREKNPIAIVLDEYGQTSGIVTMEDIVEEIVGNIQDEYDEDEELVKRCEDGSYIVSGMLDLEELEELLRIEFEVEDCETLNGFLIVSLERIPGEDEECEVFYKGYRFRSLLVDNNMIQSVKIEKSDEA